MDIFALDSSIRFASVYNKHGEVIAGGMSKDKVSLLNPEEARMSIYYSKQTFEKHKNLSHRVGKERYSMTEYDKVKMISIPVQNDDLLLVSIETNADHFKMINDMLKVVESHSKEN